VTTAAAPLQVVLSVAAAIPVVMGVPAALRVAHALVEDTIDRCVFVTDSGSTLTHRWTPQLRRLSWASVASMGCVASALDDASPVLLLDPEGIPDISELRLFLDECRTRKAPTEWLWSGRRVAVYYPAAEALVAQLPRGGSRWSISMIADFQGGRVIAHARAWYDLNDLKAVERAERDLLLSLRKETDGYLARLDRGISIPISLVLARTPITPNAITLISLLIGLLGVGLLAVPTFAPALTGAVLLWCTCVLDGCDGEVARLKLLSTPGGARFDVVADNIVHVGIFIALPIHLRLSHATTMVIPAGVVLLAGMLLSMASVWWLLLRQPVRPRGAVALFYERVASRDFIYLIVVLAAVRRLEWFLWAAAAGSHLFWITLWLLSRRRP